MAQVRIDEILVAIWSLSVDFRLLFMILYDYNIGRERTLCSVSRQFMNGF